MIVFSSVLSNLENMNMLNVILVNWNMSDKSQRFGQYVENNTNLILGSELYYEVDSYKVYAKCCDLIEGFYNEVK